MIAATCRVFQWAAFLFVGFAASAFGEVLDYRTAIGSSGSPVAGGSANFRSVVATPVGLRALPPRAFAGGAFATQFNMGQANPIVSQNRDDAVLAGFTRDPASQTWAPDWLLAVGCEFGDAVINDITLSPIGEIVVAGTFVTEARFDLPPPQQQIVLIDPAGGGAPTSFIAIASQNGEWRNALVADGMEIRSLAIDERGDIFVTGRGVLARRYTATFQELWSIPEPQNTVALTQIAVDPAPTQPGVYVLGSFVSGAAVPSEDVFLVQLEKLTGAELWRTIIATPADERPGGLGLGPLGNLRVSVSSDGRNLRVNGTLIQDLATTPSRHSHLLFLAPDGLLIGDRLLGTSTAVGGVMETHNLDIDYAGNSYVSVSFDGNYTFKGAPHGGQGDAAVVAVDALGVPLRFSDSDGTGVAIGSAVAVVNRNIQVLVGGLQGSGPEFFGSGPAIPAQVEERAYFSALEAEANQQAYILTDVDPAQPLSRTIDQINQVEGDIYRVLDFPTQNLRMISVNLTTEQAASIRNVNFVLDLDLHSDGTVNPAGWGLEALNNAPIKGLGEYTYPETCHDTVLYLIDTAIDTSSGYFDTNTNLTIGTSILVRGVGDPCVSSKFDHGTEMLSMIAGPNYGAAQGTPITVVSYDIYPDGATAKVSSLIEAVILANLHKSLNHLYDPAVYCIASSADTAGASSASLVSAIDYTVGANVAATVLVSAGNTAGSASDYTPSDLGSKSGVLCVGAIDNGNPATQVVDTRGPTGVDIWAPGENVDAADVTGTLTSFTGTSAATAFATGAALIYASSNPVIFPADIEGAMITNSQTGTIVSISGSDSGAPSLMDYSDWALWFNLAPDDAHGDSADGDLWTNEEEYIWGLDPLVPDYQGSVFGISYNQTTSLATFQFQLSCYLYQPSALESPFTLRDGSTLVIERSDDLQTWTDHTGSVLPLTEVSHDGKRVLISFDLTVTTAPWFYRVAVR